MSGLGAGGFTPPETSVKHLQKLQDEYYVGCLKEFYPKCQKEWEVTKVVFVASCDQTLPTDLIDILHSILETTDPNTGFLKYNAEVFIVVTKCDLVDGMDKFLTVASNEKVAMDQLKITEDEVAKAFKIEGVQKHTTIRWMSYVGDNENDRYIDNIALKFIRQMLQPRRKIYHTEPDKMPMITRIKLKKRKFTMKLCEFTKCALVVAIIAVVLFYIYNALSGPPKMRDRYDRYY